MKISLNLNHESTSPEMEREKAIDRDVESCKRNDWEAKTRLIHVFMPLLTSLAKKRTQETAMFNRYIEVGKDGLVEAARRYKAGSDRKFQVFSLDYIEAQMNRLDRPGFLGRIFKRL